MTGSKYLAGSLVTGQILGLGIRELDLGKFFFSVSESVKLMKVLSWLA